MRIFIAVRHSIDPQRCYGGLWSANFYPALRGLGHELVESQTDLYPTSRFMDVAGDFTPQELEARATTTERILSEFETAHRQAPIDLFLSYFYNAHFDPAGFDRVRALGVPSINFYCNSIYQFANVAGIAAKVDVSWHAERDARASYLAAGANPVWVQMGADPGVYHPMEVPRARQACFVGQNYADRAQWMAALINAHVPVEIYGPGWGGPDADPAGSGEQESEHLGRRQHTPGSAGGYAKVVRDIVTRDGVISGAGRIAKRLAHQRERRRLNRLFASHARGPIAFNRQVEVFARNEVCLNFSNVWADGQPGAALIGHVRLRDFEAPMCRTCYLTGHTEEITHFYDVGAEIDTYRTPDELIDKTRYYLSNADAAERLRDAGHRRALACHTWTHRFTELFSKVNLPGR
jgi:hypothetical protein